MSICVIWYAEVRLELWRTLRDFTEYLPPRRGMVGIWLWYFQSNIAVFLFFNVNDRQSMRHSHQEVFGDHLWASQEWCRNMVPQWQQADVGSESSRGDYVAESIYHPLSGDTVGHDILNRGVAFTKVRMVAIHPAQTRLPELPAYDCRHRGHWLPYQSHTACQEL